MQPCAPQGDRGVDRQDVSLEGRENLAVDPAARQRTSGLVSVMITGPPFAARFARLMPWLNSRLESVVTVMGGLRSACGRQR